MSTRSWALFKLELRLIRAEAMSMLQIVIMPIMMMAFLTPVSKGALQQEGFRNTNGSEQAVPGMAVMFAVFLCGNVAFNIFREHGWHTWDRLRTSAARPADIMVGKLGVPLITLLVQQVVLFSAGVALFGLRFHSSPLLLLPVLLAYGLALVAMGMALAAFCKSNQQVNLLSGLLAMVLSGLGGAFVPLGLLPGWAQSVARLTPTYWAMRGYRAVILEDGGVAALGLPVIVLVGVAVAIGSLCAFRFRFDESKVIVG